MRNAPDPLGQQNEKLQPSTQLSRQTDFGAAHLKSDKVAEE